ncbi:MAG TPA: GWxTD domain-containing protein [Ignavibacteriaceae bacterium]
MKLNIKIAFLFISFTLINAQPQEPPFPPVSNNGSINFLLPDSLVLTNYLCKVPYVFLVFEKSGSDYIANYRLLVEIYSANNILVDRESDNGSVKTNKFDVTNDRRMFQNNLFKFQLAPGQYEIRTVLSDLNTDREIKLKPEQLNTLDIFSEKIFTPIVLQSEEVQCADEKIKSISNFNGFIPFSSETYSLLIPISDTSVTKLNVEILCESESIENLEITESFVSDLSVESCEDKIMLSSGSSAVVTRNFILKKINQNLYEGPVTIKVTANEMDHQKDFMMPVVWQNKPFTLLDPHQAIKYLSFIEEDEIISELLEADDEMYSKQLLKYWKKFDPDPETLFNPLMQEYYERIDYADQHFRGLGKGSGINSDRGKIYIRYGKPSEVSRSSDANGNIVETWNYLNPQKKFMFVDLRGTGNFTLIQG